MEKALKMEQDKNKKFQEMEKIFKDLKDERDLLMRQLADSYTDRDTFVKKMNELKKESQELLDKIKNDFNELE